jgi:hypothetical protein
LEQTILKNNNLFLNTMEEIFCGTELYFVMDGWLTGAFLQEGECPFVFSTPSIRPNEIFIDLMCGNQKKG